MNLIFTPRINGYQPRSAASAVLEESIKTVHATVKSLKITYPPLYGADHEQEPGLL